MPVRRSAARAPGRHRRRRHLVRPAIENHYHGPQFHFHGRDGGEAAARIIRTALPGAAITSEEGTQP
jgi:hypothetical protein